tara:strand:+ start:328 stop:639 length:312 start_codon:yes stop_codon:yes gene_type:complete
MENEKRELTEEERITIIRTIHEKVRTNGVVIDEEGQKLIDEIKATQATEAVVVEHGLLSSTEEDVRDEVNHLDTIEQEVDFDADESESDMTQLSPSMMEVIKG